MNEAFYELPKEKQKAIYNAAMEVFGNYEYKRASTDLIATKAGVSKGLLFYYFHNKKALYLHTFEYVSKIVEDAISDKHLSEITDFFELIAYGTEKEGENADRESVYYALFDSLLLLTKRGCVR